MNQNFRNFALWIVILLLLVALFNLFKNPATETGSRRDVTYSQFRTDANDGRITSVIISGQEVVGTYDDGTRFKTFAPDGSDYIAVLEERGVTIRAQPDTDEMSFLSVLVSWFPMFLLIAVWIFFMRQMQGAGGKAMGDNHDTGIYSWEYLYALGTEYDDRWQSYLQRLAEAGHERKTD